MDDRNIFLEALNYSTTGEREKYLDEACGEDPQLRQRVALLLAAHEDAGSFLEKTPEELLATLGQEHEIDLDTWKELLTPSDRDDCLGTLGGYEIRELIGRGGMGVVFSARDPELDRVVAVKMLAPELAANAVSVQRFLREARAAAAVSHDHVITIHAIDGQARPPLIVMERVAGQSLQEKIDREGPLDVKSILRIGMQTAAGLSAAHKQGLIHRDIKPSNILLENSVERVKLTDFGLARSVDEIGVTRTGQITGTPQYMSPEQAQGHAIDLRSDLFSLGCVLYAMCTGRAAFRAESAVGVMHQIVHEQPKPIRQLNEDIPVWLCSIVEKLLEKDPQNRFASATEVEELLSRHLAHLQQPDSAPRPELVSTTGQKSQRQKLVQELDFASRVFLGVGVICFVYAIVAVFTYQNLWLRTWQNAPLVLFLVPALLSFPVGLLAMNAHWDVPRRKRYRWVLLAARLAVIPWNPFLLLALPWTLKVLRQLKQPECKVAFAAAKVPSPGTRWWPRIAILAACCMAIGIPVLLNQLLSTTVDQPDPVAVDTVQDDVETKSDDPDSIQIELVSEWKPQRERGTVLALDLTDNKQWLASGHRDGGILLWNTVMNGKLHYGFEDPDDSSHVADVEFSPDDRFLAWVQMNGRLRIRPASITQTTDFDHFQPVNDVLRCLAWAPDNQTILAGGQGKLYKFAIDFQEVPLATVDLPVHASVMDIAWSPQGTEFATALEDGSLIVWNANEVLPTVRTVLHQAGKVRAHSGPVYSVAYSPTEPLLISCGDDGYVRTWHPDQSDEPSWDLTFSNGKALRSIHISPDGTLCAVGGEDRQLHLLDLDRPATSRIDDRLLGTPVHEEPVTAVCFARSASFLITGSADGTIKWWKYDLPNQPPMQSDGSWLQILQLAASPATSRQAPVTPRVSEEMPRVSSEGSAHGSEVIDWPRLLTEASSIPLDEWSSLSGDIKGPDAIAVRGEPLSLVLLKLNPFASAKENEKVRQDFWYLTETIPQPQQLGRAIEISHAQGYVSFLQREYITNVSVERSGDDIRGYAGFTVPRLYSGRVEFRAHRQNGNWKITGFTLPNYKIAIELNQDQQWERQSVDGSK